MEIKFRAVIPERNAIIYFTLNDLLQDKFSNREILWEWLEKGNQPDLFIGLRDKKNKEIYEGDIIRKTNWKDYPQLNIIGQVVIGTRGVKLKEYPDRFLEETGYSLEVIGNVWEHPNLLKGGKNATKK